MREKDVEFIFVGKWSGIDYYECQNTGVRMEDNNGRKSYYLGTDVFSSLKDLIKSQNTAN